MASKNKCVAKGSYQRSQIDHFPAVKNYIFLRDGERKRLLLRFVNGMDETVDGMAYTVFQYDDEGNLIERSSVRHSGLSIPSQGMFVPAESLTVDERCVDFEIVFSEVVSGRYVYRVIDKIVSVYYQEDLRVPIPAKKRKDDDPEHSVSRRTFGDESNARLVVLMVVLILIALNIMSMVLAFRKKMEDEDDTDPYEVTEETDETVGMNLGDGEWYVEI